jgi:hypothetical protein
MAWCLLLPTSSTHKTRSSRCALACLLCAWNAEGTCIFNGCFRFRYLSANGEGVLSVAYTHIFDTSNLVTNARNQAFFTASALIVSVHRFPCRVSTQAALRRPDHEACGATAPGRTGRTHPASAASINNPQPQLPAILHLCRTCIAVSRHSCFRSRPLHRRTRRRLPG